MTLSPPPGRRSSRPTPRRRRGRSPRRQRPRARVAIGDRTLEQAPAFVEFATRGRQLFVQAVEGAGACLPASAVAPGSVAAFCSFMTHLPLIGCPSVFRDRTRCRCLRCWAAPRRGFTRPAASAPANSCSRAPRARARGSRPVRSSVPRRPAHRARLAGVGRATPPARCFLLGGRQNPQAIELLEDQAARLADAVPVAHAAARSSRAGP